MKKELFIALALASLVAAPVMATEGAAEGDAAATTEKGCKGKKDKQCKGAKGKKAKKAAAEGEKSCGGEKSCSGEKKQ